MQLQYPLNIKIKHNKVFVLVEETRKEKALEKALPNFLCRSLRFQIGFVKSLLLSLGSFD